MAVTYIRNETTGMFEPISSGGITNITNISVNPNLLVNSDFRNPVNQRGQTTYTPTENVVYYTIDRWAIYPSANDSGHSLTINDGYLTIANTNSNMSMFFAQYLETPLSGTYTITIKIKSATKAASLSYRDNGTVYDLSTTLTEGVNSITFECNSLDCIRIGITGANSVDIEYIKLEYGSTATQFVPRHYAEELAICQRYYTVSNGIKMPVTYGSDSLFIIVPLPVKMRDNPIVVFEKTSIGVVCNDSSTASSYTIDSHVVNMTATHIILTIHSNYETSVFKSGCIMSDFPMTFDAEIY